MKSIGRNSPCPCGSGKKYKKCCLLIDSRRGESTQPGKFRFEPGSYGHPESCMPSIACLKHDAGSWKHHFVLVKSEELLNDPDIACAKATADLNQAFSKKSESGSDEAVPMYLKSRGYVSVDNFNIVDPDEDLSATWMDNDGLHMLASGLPPTPESLDAATKVYQENVRNSPLWDQMVKEYGEEEAKRLLSEFRVETRH